MTGLAARYWLWLVAGSVVALWVLPAALQAKTRDSMFGVHLRPSVVKLLGQVEETYGKPVKGILDSAQRVDIPSQAVIEEDGSPVIRINPSTGANEAAITHELMHLYWWARGVPWVGFMGEKPADPVSIRLLRDDLYDLMFHAFFYPKIRALDIDPAEQEREALRELLSKKSLPIASNALAHASLALYYFKAAFLLEDDQLAGKLADVFAANGQQRALDDGKKLVAIAKNHRFQEPDEVLEVFTEAANILLAGDYRGSVRERRSDRKGSITLEIAESLRRRDSVVLVLLGREDYHLPVPPFQYEEVTHVYGSDTATGRDQKRGKEPWYALGEGVRLRPGGEDR